MRRKTFLNEKWERKLWNMAKERVLRFKIAYKYKREQVMNKTFKNEDSSRERERMINRN